MAARVRIPYGLPVARGPLGPRRRFRGRAYYQLIIRVGSIDNDSSRNESELNSLNDRPWSADLGTVRRLIHNAFAALPRSAFPTLRRPEEQLLPVDFP